LFSLEENDLLLGVSMSISMFEEFRIDGMSKEFVGNNLFANSLIGAPVQNGCKRERSDITCFFII